MGSRERDPFNFLLSICNLISIATDDWHHWHFQLNVAALGIKVHKGYQPIKGWRQYLPITKVQFFKITMILGIRSDKLT